MSTTYFIRAIWDPVAKVYCSESNVPGLVVEAATLPEFLEIADELFPEMLRANTDIEVSASSRVADVEFKFAV